MNLYLIVVLVIAIFVLERATLTALVHYKPSRRWLRHSRWLHPNMISVVRMPMGLATVALWQLGMPTIAFFWFALWMISDLTDGTIARHCNLVTETGKWLDPLSDKLLYLPVLLLFAWHGALPPVWIIALTVVDVLGQGSRLLTKKKAANVFGKSKTALVTVLLVLVAFQQLAPDRNLAGLLSPAFLHYLAVFCTVLAFLSAFCKIIPDVWYANSLSLANFGCGVASIYYVVQGYPMFAFMLVFLGQFFDLFDGRLARKYGSTRCGPIFDDVADGTSFGLAVAFIVYYQFNQSWPALLVATVYLVAVIFRLVRFLLHNDILAPGVFEGLPSPAGAMLAGSTALLFDHLPWLGLAVVVGSALLMASSLHYLHFARRMWHETPNMFKVAVCLLVLLFVSRTLADQGYRQTFKIAAFSLAALYLILGNETVALRLSGTPENRSDGAGETTEPSDEEQPRKGGG